MSNATLINNAREWATILEQIDPLYPVQPSMLRDLASALEEAQGVIEKARAIPHGPFGPWEDDLCDYGTLSGILDKRD